MCVPHPFARVCVCARACVCVCVCVWEREREREREREFRYSWLQHYLSRLAVIFLNIDSKKGRQLQLMCEVDLIRLSFIIWKSCFIRTFARSRWSSCSANLRPAHSYRAQSNHRLFDCRKIVCLRDLDSVSIDVCCLAIEPKYIIMISRSEKYKRWAVPGMGKHWIDCKRREKYIMMEAQGLDGRMLPPLSPVIFLPGRQLLFSFFNISSATFHLTDCTQTCEPHVKLSTTL